MIRIQSLSVLSSMNLLPEKNSTDFATSYNPQSDGQVERLNKTMEGIMRTYIKDRIGWVKYLQAADFAYNTRYIRCSPFLALRGYIERLSGLYNPFWEKPKLTRRKINQPIANTNLAMENYLKEMNAGLQILRDTVAEAQDQQSIDFNKKNDSQVESKIGDNEWVHAVLPSLKTSHCENNLTWPDNFISVS